MSYSINLRAAMVAMDRFDETTANQVLRRADWRFLLPDPRPAQSICFARGPIARAVAAISDRVINPKIRPVENCDLAVAVNPSQEVLQATWEALRPGGACYVEWTSPLSGGPARLRRKLESIGFTQAVCYWPWPWPDHNPAHYWLPLESPHVIQYVLANRARGQTVLSRLWNSFLEVAWHTITGLRLLTPLSLIAIKPPVTEPALLDTIRSKWSTWSSEPPPMHLDWMLLTGGSKTINKVVGLVFANSDPSPRLVVKLARISESATALDREAANLRAVQTLLPDQIGGIPQVLFSHDWAGQTVLGETAFAGRPLYTALRRDTGRDLALKVTEWLANLAGQVGPCVRQDWWDRLIEPTVAAFERNFGNVLDSAKLRSTRTILGTLGNLPMVCEQRDCSPWNVLIDHQGELAILDWESAVPRGLPVLDLAYFLTYLAFFLDGAMDTHRFRESFRASLDPSTFTGSIVTECQQRYLDCLSLDQEVLRPLRLLAWLIHSQSEYRRLAAECAGRPDPANLRRSLFLSLWEEELTHAAMD